MNSFRTKIKSYALYYLLIVSFSFGFQIRSLEAQTPTFEVTQTMSRIALNSKSQILIDETGTLTIRDILSNKYRNKFKSQDKSSFGYTDAIYWARIHTANPKAKVVNWVIELDYSVFDSITLYNSEGKKQYEGGDIMPFSKRPIHYRNVVFPLSAPANKNQIHYLKLQTKSSMNIPLFAYALEKFNKHILNEQIVFGIYYGLMLAMLVYNFFLFISTHDRIYLYYVNYIAGYIIFQATINGLAFQYLWPNSIWLANIIMPLGILYAVAGGAAFSRSFLNSKILTPTTYKFYTAILVYCALAFGATFFLDYFITIRIAVFICFPVVILIYYNGIQCYRKGQFSSIYFLIAWTIFLFGVVLFAAKAFGFLPSNFLTTWSIQIGSGAEVVLLSFALANKINLLTKNLHQGMSDLELANTKIQKSEKRFRHLFNATDEFVFTLDLDLNVTSANNSLKSILGYNLDDVKGKSFFNLLYSEDTDNMNEVLINEKLEELKKSNQSIHLQASFSHKRVKEPKELSVHLQFTDEEHKELLGRANIVGENLLFKDFESEKLTINIENFLGNVELFSHRMTVNINNYLDADSVTTIKICVREVLINAIEHGNLKISFEEKSAALEKGEYFELLQERQRNPLFKDRKIKLEYILNNKFFGLRVTDQGDGFDHKKMMAKDADQLNESQELHGRGIFFMRETFDTIKYNNKGNQITLIKKF